MMKAYSIKHKPTKTWLADGGGGGYFLNDKPFDFGYNKKDYESWIEELSEDDDGK